MLALKTIASRALQTLLGPLHGQVSLIFQLKMVSDLMTMVDLTRPNCTE